MVKLKVQWAKVSLEVDADLELPGLVLKTQLFTLTGVHPDRQKVMGSFKGAPLKARHFCSSTKTQKTGFRRR